jgi:hypothetical protein
MFDSQFASSSNKIHEFLISVDCLSSKPFADQSVTMSTLKLKALKNMKTTFVYNQINFF